MKKVFGWLSLVLVAVAALFAIALPGLGQSVAPGGAYGYTSLALPGVQATVAASSTVNPTNAVFQLPAPGRFSSFGSFCGSNSGDTTTITLNYAFSPDGVNYSTTTVAHTITLNGTTPVYAFTNFSAANAGIADAQWVQLKSIVNANTHTVTNGVGTIPAVTLFSFFK